MGEGQQVTRLASGSDRDVEKIDVLSAGPARRSFDNICRHRYRGAPQLSLEAEALLARKSGAWPGKYR